MVRTVSPGTTVVYKHGLGDCLSASFFANVLKAEDI